MIGSRTRCACATQLIRVLSLVQAAETGQRGFLLTGRDDYLEPYTRGVSELPPNLYRLADLVSDNPSQVASVADLRQVVKQKLDELGSTIDASKAGHQADALAIVNNDSGFRLMQQIRRKIAAMQAEEDRLLEERQETAARSGMLLQAGVAIAFLLIVILGRFDRALHPPVV